MTESKEFGGNHLKLPPWFVWIVSTYAVAIAAWSTGLTRQIAQLETRAERLKYMEERIDTQHEMQSALSERIAAQERRLQRGQK